MAKSPSTIELNGKRYDAITGRLLATDAIKKPVKKTTEPSLPKVKVFNDIVRPAGSLPTSQHYKTIISQHLHSPAKPSINSPVPKSTLVVAKSHHAAHHLKAHTPEKAKTLTRLGVHKPGPSNPKALVRVQTPVKSSFSAIKQKSTKYSQQIDMVRLDRVRAIEPNHLVRHFTPHQAVEGLKTTVKQLGVHKPVDSDQLTAATPLVDGVLRVKPHQRRFEQAIEQAHSHEEPPFDLGGQGSRRRRWKIAAIISLAVILVGAFLTVKNMSDIDISLASMHAGFTAVLPTYQPVGFSLVGHIQASYDQVTLIYHTQTGSSNYEISQQVSNWDSQTLVNFINSTGQPLKSWQNLGNTLYKYSNHLTWVSGGIWYQITDHANLSDQQLISIAGSI